MEGGLFPDIEHSEEFLARFTEALRAVLQSYAGEPIPAEASRLELFKRFTHNQRDMKYRMQDEMGRALGHSGAQIHGYFEKVFQVFCYPVQQLDAETKLRVRALVYDLLAAGFDSQYIQRECCRLVIQERGVQTCKKNVENYVLFIAEKDKARRQDHRNRHREGRGFHK